MILMPGQIRIPIPPLAEDELVAWFQSQTASLASAMDLGVSEFDHKAQIDQIVIQSVSLESGAVRVEYELAFSVDYTCSGIEFAGTTKRTLRGLHDDATWVFQAHVPLPRRSTADEL